MKNWPWTISLGIIMVSMYTELSILSYEFFHIEMTLLRENSIKSELISEHYNEAKIIHAIASKAALYILLYFSVLNISKLWNFTKNNFKFTILIFMIFELLWKLPFGIWESFFVEKRFKFNRITPNLFFRDQIIKLTWSITELIAITFPVILFTQRKTKKSFDTLPMNIPQLHAHAEEESENNESSTTSGYGNDGNEPTEENVIVDDKEVECNVHVSFIILFLIFIANAFFSIFSEKIGTDLIDAPILDDGVHYHGIINGFVGNFSNELFVELDQRNSHYGFRTIGIIKTKPVVSENLFFLLPIDDLHPLGTLISSELMNRNTRKIYLFKLVYILLYAAVLSVYSRIGMKAPGIRGKNTIGPLMFLSVAITYSLSFFLKPLENSYSRLLIHQSDLIAGKADPSCIDLLILIYKKDLRLVDATAVYRTFYMKDSCLESRIRTIRYASSKGSRRVLSMFNSNHTVY